MNDIRLVRREGGNAIYLALLTFMEQGAADDFYRELNGQPVCLIVAWEGGNGPLHVLGWVKLLAWILSLHLQEIVNAHAPIQHLHIVFNTL